MTETQQTPQAGIAESLSNLSEQTRVLVRQEIDAATQEMWRKARQGAPAVGLLATSGALGLLAAASSYRLSLRLLEKWVPPATAAWIATIVYGGGAAAAGIAAAQRLRTVPAPLPTETAQAVVAGTAAEAHG